MIRWRGLWVCDCECGECWIENLRIEILTNNVSEEEEEEKKKECVVFRIMLTDFYHALIKGEANITTTGRELDMGIVIVFHYIVIVIIHSRFISNPP
jgi:hypothetical protein